MFALRFRSHLSSSSCLVKLDCNSTCSFTLPLIHTKISPPKKSLKNPILYNYLIDAFNFPEEKAIKVSNRVRRINTLERPKSVVNFLKSFGFSQSQIHSTVNVLPAILFADTEKILGPKLQYFRELGFSGSHLGKFIAKNSSVLTRSLEVSLKPCIANVKKIIGNDENNKGLIRVLCRCNWVVDRITNARILSNVLYLKSCGIEDNRLSTLFKGQPRLFTRSESELRGVVEKISEMGFPMDSKLLVHAIFSVATLRTETLERKLDLIGTFGFSKVDCLEMFRRAPSLLLVSEVKLRFAMDFLLGPVKLKKLDIVHWPSCLMYNVENRLVARYRVVKRLMAKGLLKKEPAFLGVVYLAEEEFVEKYVSRFPDNAEELLFTYKGHLQQPSTAEEV